MKRLLLTIVPMLFAAFANASVQQKEAGPQRQMHEMSMMQNCPMMVDGTKVAAVDTPAGIAITITTTKPENVAELRRRVQHMSVMHNTPSHIEAQNEAMMQSRMMPGNVTYESIENGARLTLTPKDPAKIAEFRAQIRAHVERHQGCGWEMEEEIVTQDEFERMYGIAA
jgi:hypothetical protein